MRAGTVVALCWCQGPKERMRLESTISINAYSGLMSDARQVPSPNCDDRPLGAAVRLLVIHNISLPPGIFGGPQIDDFFRNQLNPDAHPFFQEIAHVRVSSHCMIRREGSVVQYVPFHRRAWHAGASCFEGVPDCNDYSIGIELEGTDTIPYTQAQYQQLIQVILALLRSYPDLSIDRIVGHQAIAPERKTDPGPAFEWSRLFEGLRSFNL